jgi:hypothetical protein
MQYHEKGKLGVVSRDIKIEEPPRRRRRPFVGFGEERKGPSFLTEERIASICRSAREHINFERPKEAYPRRAAQSGPLLDSLHASPLPLSIGFVSLRPSQRARRQRQD